VLNGRETTPRAELQELSGTIEECKADVVGLWAMQRLVAQGQLGRDGEDAGEAPHILRFLSSSPTGANDGHDAGACTAWRTAHDDERKTAYGC